MPFKTAHLSVDVYDGHDGEWVVLDEVVWVSARPEVGEVRVPRGFVTDFASTPQWMHGLPWFDPTRQGRKGAVVHDYLYCSHRWSWTDVGANPVYGHAQSRLWCDDVLREALGDGGMSPGLARAYWLGVRAGGWAPWDRRGNGLQDDDFVPPSYWEIVATR